MPTKENFAAAARELSSGQVDAGLWAMATSEALGNKERTHATYLRLRAEELSQSERAQSTVSSASLKEQLRKARDAVLEVLELALYFNIAFVVLTVSVFLLLGVETQSIPKHVFRQGVMAIGIGSVLAGIFYRLYKKSE